MMTVIVPINFLHFVGHVAVNLVTMLLTYGLFVILKGYFTISLMSWILEGVLCVIVSTCITAIFNMLFYRVEFQKFIKKFVNIWRKKDGISR